MPPSLSSIQWLGALSRFMCFFGPRGMAATAVSARHPLQEEEPRPGRRETQLRVLVANARVCLQFPTDVAGARERQCDGCNAVMLAQSIGRRVIDA